eukprot:g3357.t1
MARTKQTARSYRPKPESVRAKLPSKKPRSPLKSRIQFEMRTYRRELCPFMTKPEATKLLMDVYFNRCGGRRHKMKRVAPLLVQAASTGARGDALFKELTELETASWAHMGIVETVSPEERQEQSAWVQSFSSKGSMCQE